VINRNGLMPVLLDACPSFAPAWRGFVDEWDAESENLPLYLALAQLARHLCAMLARGETGAFPQVFAAVEQLLVDGDEYVQEATCIGLLENLQNANVHTGTEPEQFRPLLGPKAAQCWSDLSRFWRDVGGRVEQSGESKGRGGPVGMR